MARTKFGKTLIVVAFLVTYVTCSTDQSQCQPTSSDLCKSIVGNTTRLPNFFGHATQLEALTAMNELLPFVQIRCSPHIQDFLCLLYFPICSRHVSSGIYACSSSCELVRDACSEAFLATGLSWPLSLDCSQFVDTNSGTSLCVEFNQDDEITERPVVEGKNRTQTPNPQPPQRPDPKDQCESILEDNICKGAPYSSAIFPNTLGHRNRSEAAAELHKYNMFLSMDDACPTTLRMYLCAVYYPPCKVIGDVAVPIPPCRSLCTSSVSYSCLTAMEKFNMELPTEVMECQRLPPSSLAYPRCLSAGLNVSDSEVSVMEDWSPPPNTRSNADTTCEGAGCSSAAYRRCRALGFRDADFPNFFEYVSIEEVSAELDRLAPLVNSGCSKDIQLFICSALLDSKRPCVDVCLRVWKSCRDKSGTLFGKRPLVMLCRHFFEEYCEKEIRSPEDEVDIIYANRVNITHCVVGFTTPSQGVVVSLLHPRTGERQTKHLDQLDVLQAQQVYFKPDHMDGYQVVMIPFNKYGIGPPTSRWIQGYIGVDLPGHCRHVDKPMCRGLGYYAADRPIINGLDDEFEQLVETECSPLLKEFVCGLVSPRCMVNLNRPSSPCYELCVRVRTECREKLQPRGNGLWYILACEKWILTKGTSCKYGEDKPDITVSAMMFHEYAEIFCMADGEAPPASNPEFFTPDGNLIQVTSLDEGGLPSGTDGDVTQLSPSLTMLQFKGVPPWQAGLYSCRVPGDPKSVFFQAARDRCVDVTLFSCAAQSKNGRMRLPNLLGHTTEYKAELASYRFAPLLQTNCSYDLLRVVCALYSPECSFSGAENTQPCRELCQNVKSACHDAMARIGFEWPAEASCDLLEPAETSTSTDYSCVSLAPRTNGCIKLRRYDVTDYGVDYLFHGWADVQGQGAANDYCRVVSVQQYKILSCALAGTHGQSQYNYNSSDTYSWLDLGHTDTWYMRDENGDGRDDYCRCVGSPPETRMSCLTAGSHGFNRNEFGPEGAANDCQYTKVNRFFGA